MSVAISVSEETKKAIDKLSRKDEKASDAVARIVRVATSRLNALKRYAEKGGAPKAKAKKPAKKAPAKKKTSKKAPKAQEPATAAAVG